MLVALADPELSGDICVALPDHLEDIVTGSHPSLGDVGRRLLHDLLHRYKHVFLVPGEPVTWLTTSVQHEILTLDARPIRCGPRRLAPAGLRTEQTCVKCCLGVRLSPAIARGLPRWSGSTRFCMDYRRLNSLTTKD